MLTSTPTLRVKIIGRALLGYTADEENVTLISGVAQHTLLIHASKGELIAAKMLIQEYHPEQESALLLVEGYISLKGSDVWAIAG